MYLVDMASGEVTEGPQLLEHVNAIGYNIQDDLVYGVDRVNENLVRFGANGEIEVVASSADVLGGAASVVGDVDDVDHYWHFDFTTATWYQVDLNSTTADPAVQVDSGTVTWPSFGFDASDDYRSILDWTYVDGTDSLYAIAPTVDQDEAHLLRFDRTTKEFEFIANLGNLGDTNTFGATYTDASGYLYIGNNGTGVIYRVDPETGETLEFSDGPETSQNDGARCMNAPVPIDFGDAPASYGTLLEDNGARHSIPGYMVDETAPLMLGSNISIDTDGQPSAAADGDTHDDGVTDPIVLDRNQPTTVSVDVTNEEQAPATLAGWIDLDGNGTFDPAERVVVDVSAGSDTYELEFPATMLSDDTYARFRLFGGEIADPSPVGTTSAGEVEDYLVSARALEVEKSSDATADTRVGDTVTYSVTATKKTGTADYTADDPASLVDDLTGVLDDATLDEGSITSSIGDAPTYTEPRITWSGPLASGESVEITYEVTLTSGGDGNVRNVAFGPPCDPADPECEPVTPECDPPNEDGLDPETGLPCGEEEEYDLPRLTIVKEANTAELPAVGETATYTVTVTNEGPGDYTETAPAEMTDDLTDVLDDATLNEDSLSSTVGDPPEFTDPNVTWSGALGAGESAEISYTVTYTGEGDQLLENLACIPEPDAHPDAEPCDTVQIPGAYIVDWKSVEASDEPVMAGTVLTYTLTFTNEGQAAGDVDKVDDLTHVLDDGDVTAGPTSSDEGALTVSEITDGQFTITGSLEPGQTETVTYEVTLRPDGERGDNIASNFLLPPGGEPPPDPECIPEDDEQPDCTTTPIGEVVPSKSADPESGTTVLPGEVVTYTLTFENIGEGDGLVEYQDVLDGVLDDAALTGGPTVSGDALSASGPEDGRIDVTGTLEPGQTETVTYEFTVKPDGERGDDVLGNFVVDPGEDPEEECLEDDPLCTEHPVPEILDHKSVDPASGTPVTEGTELTYTLTFTNDGAAAGEVDRVDDLTHILDDADLVSGPESSDEALEVSGPDDANRITIAGELGPDQTVTVTYTVVVRDAEDRGDDILANFLLPPEEEPPPEPVCEPAEDELPDCTSNPVGNIVAEKSVDPESGTEVAPGDELTYTITFQNVGEGADEVDFTDHVSDVADDTVLLSGPEASDDALSVSDVEDGAFTVTGTLEAGQTVTVTYTVRVKEYDEQGNGHLANFVTHTGEDPPSECVDTDPLCTENPIEPPPDEQPPPEDDLPDTGAGLERLLVLAGIALMLAGLALAVSTSRRSRSDQTA